MSTIKDIANYTNLSPSTVSIVLAGNGDARKISKVTQHKVMSAAQELGCQPNLQAKVLRQRKPAKPIVTLFWASDIRVHMLSRFLNGLQDALLVNQYPFEIVIKPYHNDHLNETLNEDAMLHSSGMIICNPSEKDMVFLEQLSSSVPIVLYNRYSKKYATVNMDDKTIGRIPAKIFLKHGKKRPAIIRSEATFNGMNIRTNIFSYEFYEALGVNPVMITVDGSKKGGYEGALKLAEEEILPDCVFCTSDSIALGALKAFHQKGIKIPEDVELISVGNGNLDQEEYSIPALSVIKLPMEEMAAACLAKLHDCITNYEYTATSQEFDISYVPRESCGE